MAINEQNRVPKTAASKKVGSMLGFDAHYWEQLMVGSLALVGVAGVAVALFTAAVIISQRRENSEAKAEFERYKLETGETIAKANKAAADANERAADLQRQADEARLQTEKLKASVAWRELSKEQFEIISESFRSIATPFELSADPTDPEATRLALSIKEAISAAGKKVELLRQIAISSRAATGIQVIGPKEDAIKIATPFLKAGINVTYREKKGVVELRIGSKPPPM